MDKALWEVPCDTCGHACKLHVSIGDVCIVLRCPCIAAIPATKGTTTMKRYTFTMSDTYATETGVLTVTVEAHNRKEAVQRLAAFAEDDDVTTEVWDVTEEVTLT